MPIKPRYLLCLVLAACASSGAAPAARPAAAAAVPDSPGMAPATPPVSRFSGFPDPDSATVLHLLNRLTFGAAPGDIARVQQLGIERWLNEQLHPSSIADPVQDEVRQRYAIAFESPAELYRQFPPPQRARRQQGDSAMDTMAVVRFARNQRALGGQLVLATVLREAESRRQLQEVMTDFWFNHFNVFIGKQATRWVLSDYIETAIRPHALGSFEDLLKAVAHHPAMLIYLDNAQSIAPGSQPPAMARRALAQAPEEVRQRMPQGLNENYARELLELHTLGVDGGYTQADVQNVARILTGWSMVGPGPLAMEARGGNQRVGGRGFQRRMAEREPFTFEFRDWAHDRGEKVVMGTTFPAGHMEDEGERLLTMLARHPATARHLAHKLCARFVADDAPDGCVDHAVSAYLRSNGNIAETLRAIVESHDFWAATNRRAKVKSPLEFVVSALRATGAQPDTTPRLAGVLQQLGQPLFQQQVPTGYPETQQDWVNSGALLNRMNVAVGLAAGRLQGTVPGPADVIAQTADKDALIAQVNATILGGQASANTLRVLRRQVDDLNDPLVARALAIGLALGSPDFQKQ